MKKNSKVIITAALAGAGTYKNNNPSVPYTPSEFAEEANKAYRAGAAIVHIHGRRDDGWPTAEIDRIREICDAVKQKTPELVINLSSAAGIGSSAEARLAQVIAIKPEVASLNTNSMNFSYLNRKTGEIIYDSVFTNTFKMIQEFGSAMERDGIKPEIEIYDIGGMDNILLLKKQGFFSNPMIFSLVWGVAGGASFRPSVFEALLHSMPEGAIFSSCGVGIEQYKAITQSCILGGHMRVGLEDNVKMPNGDLAKGSWEQVEVAVRIAEALGREAATPDEARVIFGIKK